MPSQLLPRALVILLFSIAEWAPLPILALPPMMSADAFRYRHICRFSDFKHFTPRHHAYRHVDIWALAALTAFRLLLILRRNTRAARHFIARHRAAGHAARRALFTAAQLRMATPVPVPH